MSQSKETILKVQKMSKEIIQINDVLNDYGPLDSQAFADTLVSKKGIKSATARKQIQRAQEKGLIKSTYPVRFDKLFLYYLQSQEGNAYAQAIKNLLPQKPAFFRVFKVLLANKGFITSGQIAKSSGCLPDESLFPGGGRQRLQIIIDQLIRIRLIEEVSGSTGIYSLGNEFGGTQIPIALFRTKIQLEQALLHSFVDWLKDCYLLAYQSHSKRTNETEAIPFNQSFWDIHGPLYFGPLTENKSLRRISTKEDFLVGEIIGFRQFNNNDAFSTIERIKNILHRWKSISLTTVILAPSFSKEAHKKLREHGIIPIILRNVFGRNIEALLQHFWKVYASEGIEQLDEIERSLELSKGTVTENGIIGNLRGTLFELLIALAFKAEGFDIIHQRKIQYKVENKTYEIDVVASRGDSDCKLVECKGRSESYKEDKQEIKKHFEYRCRAATDKDGWNIKTRYKNIEAIFITSGSLDDLAMKYAEEKRRSYGIDCSVMIREDVISWLSKLGQDSLVKIIKRFY